MKPTHRFWDRILAAAQLDTEVQLGVPVVELAGDRQVLIEKHQSVLHYTPEQIIICMEYGHLCIKGCDLKLARLGREQLVVKGRIRCLLIQGGNCA